jgi:beta-aspartyl-peptidase (threonine type)
MSASLSSRGVRCVLLSLLLAVLAAFAVLTARGGGSAGEARAAAPADRVSNVLFAIHGGAGTIRRQDLTEEQERAYRAGLATALKAGRDALRGGADATEAVTAAIVTMEDNELFNAGKGAVFTTDATQELDASIMDGRSLDTGAVTGVEHIKNPIRLADAVRTGSRHVMFAGRGAELYAQHKGFDLVTQEYFHTDRRFKSLLDAKQGNPEFEFGTVGAVAIDREGDLAAGTSTGGLTNKPVGRIGDSPIIGAGTYANNKTAAVSATGTGELFIRQVAAHELSAAMEYGRMGVDRAARAALSKVEQIGGDDSGGLIALDGRGTLTMPFNTEGMYRGYVTRDGEVVTKIYGDE